MLTDFYIIWYRVYIWIIYNTEVIDLPTQLHNAAAIPRKNLFLVYSILNVVFSGNMWVALKEAVS